MKILLNLSRGERRSFQILRHAFVLLVASALVFGFWTATTPLVSAAPADATQTLEANIPSKKSLRDASKADLLAAITAAVKSSPKNVGQLVRAAAQAQPSATADIVSAAIRALGRNPSWQLVADAVEAGLEANPDQASEIIEAALRLAPNYRAQLENIGTRGGEGEGNFGNAPANQNPAPGSVGGGSGSQSGQCQVCHRDGQGRRRTLTISCNAVPAHIRHGDTEGACPVTPTQNP